MFSAGTLKRIIDNCPDKSKLAEYLDETFKQEENIRRDLDVLQRDADREDKEHRKELARFRDRLVEIQSCCKHHVVHFEGDPSGGSDSCYICETCGKELYGKQV